ncbi:MAG: glutamate-5-semialdehyde dehydrogenase [Clostridia bacterium]|nr:glutamate-5-semialdehyde dehydrogenase [Clostridia bacterium]
MRVREQAELAKRASIALAGLGARVKDAALFAMADALERDAAAILQENAGDLDAAREAGHTAAFMDRLRLDEARIAGMAAGLRKLAALPDPVGSADGVIRRPNGLTIEKRRVPLGVAGIIFEARPNVTADAAGLCLKSGNACLLKGGSEALRSNRAIADCLRAAAGQAGVDPEAIQLVTEPGREAAREMMRLNGLIDVLIPRGGAGLIRSVVENASVPVIETGLGVCHAYVDESAEASMAEEIVYNAKCSRPSVCNALETLLIHEAAASALLPGIAARLSEKGTELRGCPRTRAILPQALPASEEDWEAEYGDYILSIRVVDSMDEAIRHIGRYGTHHSETIITRDYAAAERFLNEVDAAAVYVNASTRFTDGEEFGLGAEIGISTQKLHARGPMGLRELTSVKYVVRGNGQVR